MPGIEIERAKQIFRFLKAFAERKLPTRRRLAEQLWHLAIRDMPSHSAITIGQVTLTAGDSTADEDSLANQEPLVRVRRPKITTAPGPPETLRDWIQEGWENPDGSAAATESRTFERDGQTVSEQFAADSARVSALANWQSAWSAWAKAELPARQAMRVFERLYELRGRIERESESVELLLGDGRLRWRTSEGVIDHPVLLQRVELVFDPTVPEFRVVDADRPPELYGTLLQASDGLAAANFNDLRIELEQGGYHPLAGPETNAYLARLAALVHAKGVFLEKYLEEPAKDEPVLLRDPVLFLRTRLSGFPAAFERILIDLEGGAGVPVSITRLVGVEPPPPIDSDPPPASPWGEPPDVLLSKPANLEQVQIARALERHRAVLVQGPPGTGKSHTIANLIGHLVAQGKRVLVTSHTTKALRVLRDQIVESLRPLAVAVLDRDLDSRAQMEAAVRGILARLTVSTDEALQRDASAIREKRARLNTDIDQLTGLLRDARAAEYQPIRFAGEDTDPAEASRWIRDNQTGNDWIPGPVEPGAPLPLSSEEVRRLYEINGLLSPSDEAEISASLPNPTTLPDVRTFRSWVKTPSLEERPAMARFWPRRTVEEDIPKLEQFRQMLAAFTTDLDAMTSWQKSLITAGHAGAAEWSLWDSLARTVNDAHDLWQSHRPLLMECHVVGQCVDSIADGRAVIRQILRYLEGRSAVGRLQLLLHRKWKAQISAFRVNDRVPASARDFQAIAAHLETLENREALCRRWARQAEPVGLPKVAELGEHPEPALAAFVRAFPALGSWWLDRWKGITELARDSEVDLEQFRQFHFSSSGDVLPFDRDVNFVRRAVVGAIDVRLAIARRLRAARELRELERKLIGYEGKVVKDILQSVVDRDPAAYDLAFAELLRVAGKHGVWQERRDLTSRLGMAAPLWATALRNRAGAHGATVVPGDAQIAWRWQQLHEEIERRAALDEAVLTTKLEQRRRELQEATADLIDRQAWLAQLKRTDLLARQALQGWADTVRKIGKGTGKRTAELQGRARQLLVQARNAVPVWIMPLSRVAESFDASAGRFDVVIVDEASQSDIQGLLAWYLGDRVAIVGDHEQVSPMAVGQELDVMKALISQHLHDVPNQHLYDGTTSIYDLGRQCFGGTIALREHFRCVPDIIEFSNELSYNFEIRPLRNPSTATRPHVVEFVVSPGIGPGRDGKTNLAEARATVALMAAAISLPEYAGKSIGAITLLGDEQAVLIQQLALEAIGAVALDSRRFVAGNSAQFQGDERDVMFLSMVDSPTGGVLRISQAPAMKQRYNVAASRAKDQLWLVHSLDPNRDLQAGDLRRRLIDHIRDPSVRRRELEKAARRTESPFERAVLEHLIAANYKVQPQVWVGRYRIDFVVSSGTNQVAVECDGDRFHGIDQIPEDMARQAVLERAGWRFIRIRGTRFYRDQDATMSWAFGELNRLGVQPVRVAVAESTAPADDQLKDKVVRRAWEILRERQWISLEMSSQVPVVSQPTP